jgi:tetratricopeptide (TPR) repeat protein
MSDPRVVRAQALFARGDFRTAADVLAPLVKPPVRDFDAAYLMARLRVALRQSATAIEMFDTATRLKPDSADAWLDRGRALYDVGRLDDALSSFEKAMQLEPDSADAHYSCGTLCTMLQRHEEALQHYDRAANSRPNDIKLLTNRAASLHALGRYDEAIASFDLALELDPENPALAANRAAVEVSKAQAASAS